MSRFLLALAAIFMSGALFFQTITSAAAEGSPTYERQLAAPKVMAVTFYADWCGNCKILDPKIEQARQNAELDRKDVLFVTLDLTDKPAIHQSILLGTALGIEDTLKANGAKTGYMMLINPDTKQEITRFTRDATAEEIVAALMAELES